MSSRPLWSSEIINFRLDPQKAEYAPKENVVAIGKLIIHKLWWTEAPSGRQIKIYIDGTEIPGAVGVTGHDGLINIAFALPATPGIYVVRALFPGHDWLAAEDGCWSDPITVKVTAPTPPPPPPPGGIPPIPSDYKLPLMVAAGVGIAAVVGLLIWRSRR